MGFKPRHKQPQNPQKRGADGKRKKADADGFITESFVAEIAQQTMKEFAGDLVRDQVRPVVERAIERAVKDILATKAFQKRLTTETRKVVREIVADIPLRDIIDDHMRIGDEIDRAIQDTLNTCAVSLVPGVKKPKRRKSR